MHLYAKTFLARRTQIVFNHVSSVPISGEISPNGRNLTLIIWRKWAKLKEEIGESKNIEDKVGDLGEIKSIGRKLPKYFWEH